MELELKTTILLSRDYHKYLTGLAKQRGVSLGRLIREACEARYGSVSREDRLRAVRELCKLNLPVGTPEEMERESVPEPEEFPS